MEQEERDAIVSLCMMAAMADGRHDPAEQERMRVILEELGGEGVDPGVYGRVVAGETDVEREAARLSTPELRKQAFEMAVAVCEADGSCVAAEGTFLDRLARALGLSPEDSRAIREEADAIAAAEYVPKPTPSIDVDALVKKYAVVCAALELLPSGLAGMAIIPMQLKLVHAVSTAHGHALDRGHAREFLAAVGAGVGSRVVERFVRRMIGGLLGGGKKGGGRLIATAAGAGVTFASTWAIGRVAHVYYGSGRKLDAGALRAEFEREVSRGRELFSGNREEIEHRASALAHDRIIDLVRSDAL